MTETTTWTFTGWFGRDTDVELEAGVLNEHAQDVFSRGHCHSLALALYDLIPDAELMGAWRDGQLEHVYVRLRDGRALDINGLSADGYIEEWMGGFTEVFTEQLDLEELQWTEERGDFRRNRKEQAVSFAEALIEREGVELDVLVAA